MARANPPQVDQLVMVQVQSIEDMGAYVKLVRTGAACACTPCCGTKY